MPLMHPTDETTHLHALCSMCLYRNKQTYAELMQSSNDFFFKFFLILFFPVVFLLCCNVLRGHHMRGCCTQLCKCLSQLTLMLTFISLTAVYLMTPEHEEINFYQLIYFSLCLIKPCGSIYGHCALKCAGYCNSMTCKGTHEDNRK